MPDPASQSAADWEAADEILGKWRDTIGQIQNAHYRSAIYVQRLNYALGIPALVISTAVGSTIFATISDDASNAVKIVLGLLSLAAAVLAGLQTWLGYKETAARHHIGGVRYGALLRLIDQTRSFPFERREDAKAFLDLVRGEWDSLQKELPMISQHVWENDHTLPQRIAGRTG
ncbi:SLATT domain-containing protein [Longimicrobium sp.]|uniref:SLATT domain-containing protein n=1 Tax=Longimicrobium sp. TaxID=2029185 RepID=UPI0039C99552